jgi:high-affinity Fe2+/Pb2+ permease
MLKRLEQVTALVVAAGLAIVSYWLFFSWAQGGAEKKPADIQRTDIPKNERFIK